MAFKLPSFGLLGRPTTLKRSSLFDGLPKFSWDDISDKEEIGRGTFGCVFTAKKVGGERVVVKKLLRQHDRETRLFAKEARILNSLRFKHIVNMKAVCENPVSMMMEYLYFDFAPFGLEGRVSSLQDYLDLIGAKEEVLSPFACLHNKIAEDTALGLNFLHERNIVHRDLKPANLLISNQHYCHQNIDEIREAWAKEPVICKLVDFGESRAALQQTGTLCHTRTNNVDRGTVVFMAPELVSCTGEPMTLEQLKACDVWALGMVIFMLLNPDLEFPYQYELDQLPQKTFECLKGDIARRFKQCLLPTWSSKHSKLQATAWWELEAIFYESTRFGPKDRPSAGQVVQLFQNVNTRPPCRDIPLSASQSTAIECNDKLVAIGATPLNENIPNDATNSCAFLSVLITELFIVERCNVKSAAEAKQWNVLSSEIDNIILAMPSRFNPFREIKRMYDVSEAYTILRKAKIVSQEFEFHEELITSHGVFSRDGREALLKATCALSTASPVTNVAIYSCGRYIFVIGCHSNQYFLVETHPISEELGGVGNGLIKVYPAQDLNSARHLCSWIWKRLQLSGVQENSLQSFLIVEKTATVRLV